ncbi:MAG: DUF126 domain-containing protein [Kiloniellales bacterium]|nr:DUF126 domain-containing protein [Kiloniellales bacterium]
MTADALHGEVLLPGAAEGAVLKLDRPISFWGGVDPESGRISDPRHPQHGEAVGGRVLVIPETIGSSSGSAVMLELIARGLAPAAVILGKPDAILILGVVVALEMGYRNPPPAVLLPPADQAALVTGQACRIGPEGSIETGPAPAGSA